MPPAGAARGPFLRGRVAEGRAACSCWGRPRRRRWRPWGRVALSDSASCGAIGGSCPASTHQHHHAWPVPPASFIRRHRAGGGPAPRLGEREGVRGRVVLFRVEDLGPTPPAMPLEAAASPGHQARRTGDRRRTGCCRRFSSPRRRLRRPCGPPPRAPPKAGSEGRGFGTPGAARRRRRRRCLATSAEAGRDREKPRGGQGQPAEGGRCAGGDGQGGRTPPACLGHHRGRSSRDLLVLAGMFFSACTSDAPPGRRGAGAPRRRDAPPGRRGAGMLHLA